MQHNTETKIWNATLYLRLSRDDGDKEESNSITGQRELLRDFIRTRPELREYAVRIDDGFTGSNFERPSFKKMLEDVKAGRTNCIIVKDLSRFGRDYLTVGDYISLFWTRAQKGLCTMGIAHQIFHSISTFSFVARITVINASTTCRLSSKLTFAQSSK